MKIREIYEVAVSMGIAADPRGADEVNRRLQKLRQSFNEMKESEKKEFDQEKLHNPYSDTRILVGDPETEVREVLTGIDMEVGEVLLADRLRQKGLGIDLIISHHPEGKALAALHEVMHIQEDELQAMGVSINVAEGIMAERISQVQRAFAPVNHNRTLDAARLLGLPFMSVHTPADNLVSQFLTRLISEQAPETLGELLKVLKAIPEYGRAVEYQAGPRILVGSEKRRAGKIYVDMTGGTSGSKEAYEKMEAAGVGTLVVMHMSEEHRKEAEKHHINVINAGHMASDSIGLNLFLDALEKRGVRIHPCSGLIRVSRVSEK